MTVTGSKVGIVGGSIAGCAAAVALRRLGCEVDVFERSSGTWRDRGAGIGIPISLRQDLMDAGYLPASYPSIERRRRRWIIADGTDDGRCIWIQHGVIATNNWGVLWRSLRAQVPDAVYHDNAPVTTVRHDATSAFIDFADGTTTRFDIVIGADGYRSAVRAALYPETQPSYAGYVLWRGDFPESRVPNHMVLAALDAAHSWLTVAFDGGHGVMYPIPDVDKGTEPSTRRINWAIYAQSPTGLDVSQPSSIPPGAVTPDLYDQLLNLLEHAFPPSVRELFTSPREDVSIQPIYDQSVDAYVQGRVALIGDAGTVSRPHTGSGATKAMQDARQLEALGQKHTDWTSLLDAYNTDRSEAGRSLVALGRRIGHSQVEHTPPWQDMTAADFDAWVAQTLSGDSLYFYGDDATTDDVQPETLT